MKKINAQVTEKGWLNFSYLKKVNTLVTSQFVAEKEKHIITNQKGYLNLVFEKDKCTRH